MSIANEMHRTDLSNYYQRESAVRTIAYAWKNWRGRDGIVELIYDVLHCDAFRPGSPYRKLDSRTKEVRAYQEAMTKTLDALRELQRAADAVEAKAKSKSNG